MAPNPFPSRTRGSMLRAAAWIGASVLALQGGTASAQSLAVKTAVAGLEPFACSVGSIPEPPPAEEGRQAAQLGSTARQAVILGDLTRARDLRPDVVLLYVAGPDLDSHEFLLVARNPL